MERRKFNLWFSKSRADKGKLIYIPSNRGRKVIRCTGITKDKTPPTISSKFLTSKYLKVS